MDFTGKCVLVTGAGAGIGRAVSLAYAKAGAKVVVNSRNTAANQGGPETVDMIKKSGGEADFVSGDVSKPDEAENIVREALNAYGRIDILVNNAGVVTGGSVEQITVEQYDYMMDINVKGVFLMSKYTIPHMRQQGGGVIVNVSSVAALKGIVDRSIYAASKGAVYSLTRAMAADHLRDKIRVNCVCPGTTLSPSLEDRIKSSGDPGALEAMVARQPLGRLGNSEEIANAVLFASWDEVSFMDGSTLVIDGGMTM